MGEHSYLWGRTLTCGGACSPMGNTLTCGGALSPMGSTLTCGEHSHLWGAIPVGGVFSPVREYSHLSGSTVSCGGTLLPVGRALLPEGSTPLTGKLLYLLQGGHIPPPHMSTSFMPPVRCSLAIRMMGAASVPPLICDTKNQPLAITFSCLS